jgi:hypothetical protein
MAAGDEVGVFVFVELPGREETVVATAEGVWGSDDGLQLQKPITKIQIIAMAPISPDLRIITPIKRFRVG